MAFIIGVMLAMAIAVLARTTRFDRDRAYYPVVLMVIASYYVLFAVIGGSTRALILELIVMMAFTLVAVAGSTSSRWLIIVGLAAHGVFDLFHGGIISNPGVPPWWPAFCLAFDVATAGVAWWLQPQQFNRPA